MGFIEKEFSDNFAYDISMRIKSEGEIWDDDVISQSITLILSTSYGERLFNTSFGSPVFNMLFNTFSNKSGEELLDEVALAIKTYEDRVTVLEDKMIVEYDDTNNTIILEIPYYIKKTGKSSVWKKKIVM